MDNYRLYPVDFENISTISGCFIRDNQMGQMNLSSFFICIKSLVTDYSYEKNIKLGNWVDICGYMKK